jgi:SAM-dependent methyltransferase
MVAKPSGIIRYIIEIESQLNTLMNIEITCGACCANTVTRPLLAQEKMFGLGDQFAYVQCNVCGCLQLHNQDVDFSRYYPSNYYSLASEGRKSRWTNWLEKTRNRYAVGQKGILGKILCSLKPHAPLESLSGLQLHTYTKILDVGCGNGELLRSLHDLGFKSLSGVDPNIKSDIYLDSDSRIYKGEIQNLKGSYDLIMFHHSLEHIPDQIGALHAAERLLAPNGRCLIRIPVMGKMAWRIYGVNWVQIDAPRHLFLHTELSLNRLAERSGFKVVSITFDSNEFQFWGSECLRRGVPLFDAITGLPNPDAQKIRRTNLRNWKKKARELNSLRDGDQVCITLQRSSEHLDRTI